MTIDSIIQEIDNLKHKDLRQYAYDLVDLQYSLPPDKQFPKLDLENYLTHIYSKIYGLNYKQKGD